MKLFGWFQKRASDFDALCEKARHDLATKTAAHQGAWGLGTAERWDLDQEVGKLVFTFPEKIASCDAQIVGTWNSRGETWRWAWSNGSIAEPLTTISLKMREYGAKHGIERFTNPKWSATEDDAWLMAALASLLFEQQGVYRGPAGETYAFMTFSAVILRKR
jgi:hypothetical protein